MEALLELVKDDVSMILEGDVVKINNRSFPANDPTCFQSADVALNYKTLYIFYTAPKLTDVRAQLDQENFTFKLPVYRSLKTFFTSKDISSISQLLDESVVNMQEPLNLYKFPTPTERKSRGGPTFNLVECDASSVDLTNKTPTDARLDDLISKFNSLEQTESFLSNTKQNLHQVAKRFTVSSSYFKNETAGTPIILLPKAIYDAPITLNNFFSTFSPKIQVEGPKKSEGKTLYHIIHGPRKTLIALCDDLYNLTPEDSKNVIAAIVTGRETWFTSGKPNSIATEPAAFFKNLAGFIIMRKGAAPQVNWNCEKLVYDRESNNYAELSISFWDHLKTFLANNGKKDIIEKLW